MRLALAGAVVSAAMLAVVGGAGAASAPSVVTGAASNIGPSSATVAGTVNPNGQATSWYLEYGTSVGYGSKSAEKSAGSGTVVVDVSVTLTGLSLGTTYHYRVVAVNATGTARGSDATFSTFAAPAASTGSAANVTASSATLAGRVDPSGRPTSWQFEYGTSTSYGSTTPARSAGSGSSSVDVSAELSGLSPARTYHYRLVATSDAGVSRGADKTFSTNAAPSVTTGSADLIAPTSARLHGTVRPNGQSTSWYFDYGTSTSYGSRTSRRTVGSGTSSAEVSASLSRLRASTVYHYRLVASNGSGTSYGGDRTFSTSVAPAVTTAAAQNVGPSSATLTGTVDPKGRPTSWYFEYGTSTAYGTRTQTQNAGSGSGSRSVSASISSLTSGTTYHYRLVATNDAGTTRGADLSFQTLGVTLTASRAVVFGRGVALSGLVPTRRAGEQVTVTAQRYGDSSFQTIATVLTTDGGLWRIVAKPTITTTYQASWQNGPSSTVTVGVHPRVTLRPSNGGFAVSVKAGTSFGGRYVQLQHRSANGRWATLRRTPLNHASLAVFRPTLVRGLHTLRAAISINQAGAGYLGGISPPIRYKAR